MIKEYSVNFNTQETECKIQDKAGRSDKWFYAEDPEEKIPIEVMITLFEEVIKEYESL